MRADFNLTSESPRLMHENLNRGLHPLGFAIASDEATRCGTCIYRFVRFTGPHSGCRRHTCRKALTTGRAVSEVKVLWRGCEWWQPVEVER